MHSRSPPWCNRSANSGIIYRHPGGMRRCAKSMATPSQRRVLGSMSLGPARDYYSAIANAVSKLDKNTFAARLALFEQAKQLVVQELRARRPPASEPEIVRECAALRAAIRKVEAGLSARKPYRRPSQNTGLGGDRLEPRTIAGFLGTTHRATAALLTVGVLAFLGVLAFVLGVLS
jgi:hypothetical protein